MAVRTRIVQAKLFAAKHRKTIILLLFVAFALLFYYIWRYLSPYISLNLTTESIGIVGTIIGAIVGGSFTLLGTIWIQKRQARIKNDLHRSDTIYKPLYEELIRMHKGTLKRFPYRVFLQGIKNNEHDICYEVWNQIKSDSRYLEVPARLKAQIEELNESIKDYNESYNNLRDALDATVVEVRKNYNSIADSQIRPGWSIVRCALNHEEISPEIALVLPSLYQTHFEKEQIDTFVQYAHELNEACLQVKQVDIVYEKRSQWNKKEDQTIKLLEYMIQYSIARYEG